MSLHPSRALFLRYGEILRFFIVYDGMVVPMNLAAGENDSRRHLQVLGEAFEVPPDSAKGRGPDDEPGTAQGAGETPQPAGELPETVGEPVRQRVGTGQPVVIGVFDVQDALDRLGLGVLFHVVVHAGEKVQLDQIVGVEHGEGVEVVHRDFGEGPADVPGFAVFGRVGADERLRAAFDGDLGGVIGTVVTGDEDPVAVLWIVLPPQTFQERSQHRGLVVCRHQYGKAPITGRFRQCLLAEAAAECDDELINRIRSQESEECIKAELYDPPAPPNNPVIKLLRAVHSNYPLFGF